MLMLPGLGAGDVSLAAPGNLSSGARLPGRRVGIGTNIDLERLLPRVTTVLEELVDRRGQPAVLIGQSFGGYVARELTQASWPGRTIDHVQHSDAETSFPTADPVPVTVIYSKVDRIVPWQDASTLTHPRATSKCGAHLGMRSTRTFGE